MVNNVFALSSRCYSMSKPKAGATTGVNMELFLTIICLLVSGLLLEPGTFMLSM